MTSAAPAPASPANESPWVRWLWWAGLALFSLGAVATLLSVPYLPTNDGPDNLLSAYIENHFDDPGTMYSRDLVPAPQFAAKGFSLVFGPLEAVAGWKSALQITLCIIVLGGFWAYASLVRSLAPERRFLALLAAPLAFGWSLYMGFFSFALGQALGLVAIAFLLHSRPATPKRLALLGVLLLFQSVVHVFSAVLSGFVVAVIVLARERHRLTKALLTAALVCAPVVLIVLLARLDQSRSAETAFTGRTVWEPLGKLIRELPRFLAPGPWWRALLASAITLVALAIAVTRAIGRRLGEDETALAICAGTLLLAGIALPLHLPGWQFLSPRFLLLGALLTIALLPVERLDGRRRTALALGSVGVALASLVATHGLNLRLARSFSDVTAALAAPVHRQGMQLPIVLHPDAGELGAEVPHLAPMIHAGALFAVAQGGLIPYLFIGTASAHAFKARPDAPGALPIPPLDRVAGLVSSSAFEHDPRVRRDTIDELLSYGQRYESVIVLGARDDDVQHVLERGFVSQFRHGSVLLATFHGCSLRVEVPAALARPGVQLEIGLNGREQPLFSAANLPWVAATPELAIMPLAHLLCGRAWVRMTAADRGFDAARTCSGAVLRTVLTPESPAAVRCVPP